MNAWLEQYNRENSPTLGTCMVNTNCQYSAAQMCIREECLSTKWVRLLMWHHESKWAQNTLCPCFWVDNFFAIYLDVYGKTCNRFWLRIQQCLIKCDLMIFFPHFSVILCQLFILEVIGIWVLGFSRLGSGYESLLNVRLNNYTKIHVNAKRPLAELYSIYKQ